MLLPLETLDSGFCFLVLVNFPAMVNILPGSSLSFLWASVGYKQVTKEALAVTDLALSGESALLF